MNDRERAKTLYQELTNEQATFVDFLFWFTLGSLFGALAMWMVR